MAASPLNRLLTYAEGLLDRILAVAGAVLFAQAPEFFQQYLQRLGGHLDEANRQLVAFESSAAEDGKTIEQLIHQFAASSDPTVARMADVMTSAVERLDKLSHSYGALHDANTWSRPFVFLRDLDLGIVRATIHAFRPAVPTTAEGLVYALAGMIMFLALYHCALRPLVAALFRRRNRSVPEPRPVV